MQMALMIALKFAKLVWIGKLNKSSRQRKMPLYGKPKSEKRLTYGTSAMQRLRLFAVRTIMMKVVKPGKKAKVMANVRWWKHFLVALRPFSAFILCPEMKEHVKAN